MSDFIKKAIGCGVIFTTGAVFGVAFIHAYKQMNEEFKDLDIFDYEDDDETEKSASLAEDKSEIYSSTKKRS